MARSLATVEAEIDALRRQMAKGILRVRHGETDITYSSVADMKAALAELQAEAGRLQDKPVRQVRFKTSKGLD